MHILGVRIDNFSKKEILEKIEFFLIEKKFHQIATINPEFILQARKDRGFENILNNCNLNVTDGVGLWYAFIRHFSFLRARFAGVDLMHEILQLAHKKNLTVFLAISKSGLSSLEEIKSALKKQYPILEIVGTEIDPIDPDLHVVEIIGCEILLCNFGAPHQEKFINLVKNDTIRLAMGVGGSFDFVTGKVKRAPKIFRKIGLEWLWRLIQEPRYRIKRIWKAFPVFAFRVLINR